MKKLYYLASPYSHKDKTIMKNRVDDAVKATIDLLRKNIFCFSPIGYNATTEWTKHPLPGDWGFWESFDKCFIDHCDELIVLMIDGWRESVGVTAEINYAKDCGKPVHYITLDQIQSGEIEHLR